MEGCLPAVGLGTPSEKPVCTAASRASVVTAFLLPLTLPRVELVLGDGEQESLGDGQEPVVPAGRLWRRRYKQAPAPGPLTLIIPH